MQGAQHIGHPGGQTGGVDGPGQREPPAKKQQDAPGQLAGLLPVHEELAFAHIHRHDEEQQAEAHGDEGVIHKRQGPGDDRLQDPAEGGAAEEARRHGFFTADGPQGLQFLPDLFVDGVPCKVEGLAGQPPPGEQAEGNGHGDPQQHPLPEADMDMVVLGQEGAQERIGRRADKGAHAADAGGIGDGEHQRAGKALGFPGILPLGDDGRHGDADGQHHDGRGRIADPHADEAGGEHEARDLHPGTGADLAQDEQGDALVQVAFFHGQAQQEAAEEKIDGGVRVGGRGSLDVAEPEHGQEDDGQQGGHRQGNSFGGPPDSHEQHQAKTVPGRGRQAEPGICKDRKQQEQRAAKKAKPSFYIIQREKCGQLSWHGKHGFFLLVNVAGKKTMDETP